MRHFSDFENSSSFSWISSICHLPLCPIRWCHEELGRPTNQWCGYHFIGNFVNFNFLMFFCNGNWHLANNWKNVICKHCIRPTIKSWFYTFLKPCLFKQNPCIKRKNLQNLFSNSDCLHPYTEEVGLEWSCVFL